MQRVWRVVYYIFYIIVFVGLNSSRKKTDFTRVSEEEEIYVTKCYVLMHVYISAYSRLLSAVECFRPFRAQSLPPVVECSAADNALGYHTYRYVFNILCIILYCGLLSRIATTTMAHHHIIVLYSPTVRIHAPSANTV